MADQETLQKLFDAALKDSSLPVAGTPKRAFPATHDPQFGGPPRGPVVAVPAAIASPVAEIQRPELAVDQAPAVLDEAATAELGALLDEKIGRQTRKRRREALVTAGVFFGLTGGGLAWFVQSPARVAAFSSAISEIRSASDVKSIVAKYQAALDRLGTHSQKIDEATSALGVKASAEDAKDPNFNQEMKQMTGGEGKVAGERADALRKSFGNAGK